MIDLDLQAIVRGAVDDAFAERVSIVPHKDGRLDQSRPIIETKAILRVSGQRTKSLGEGWNISLATSKNLLFLDARNLPDLVLRRLDKVKALDRPGQPFFEVLTVHQRGEMRILVELGNA